MPKLPDAQQEIVNNLLIEMIREFGPLKLTEISARFFGPTREYDEHLIEMMKGIVISERRLHIMIDNLVQNGDIESVEYRSPKKPYEVVKVFFPAGSHLRIRSTHRG